LLRQRFNYKIGYTLCNKTHLVWLLPTVSCCLKYTGHKSAQTAQIFNCTDMRCRSVWHTAWHMLKNADRAIFPWQQCYSSFPLRLHIFCLFLSQSLPSSRRTLVGLYTILNARVTNLKYSNVRIVLIKENKYKTN